MTSYFEINYLKKVSKVNYALLTLLLAVSVSAHIIANRLVIVNGYPIIAAGFIYMSVFVLTDILATFNPRKLVIYFLILEGALNLFCVVYTSTISSMNHPDYFNHADAYNIVFGPIPMLYLANLLGTFFSAVIDLYIFKHLYNVKKWPFAMSSFFSSILTISAYTYITDYFGFRGTYPDHVFDLTHINLATNMITLAAYSSIGQFIATGINKYLNK